MNRSTCTICSDYLTASNVTACPCGHTFHYECIMTWKEHSATCPQCRIRFKEPIKLYFEENLSGETEVDSAVLKNQLSDANLKLKEKDLSITTLRKNHLLSMNELATVTQDKNAIAQLLQNVQGTNDALKKQLSYMEKYKVEAKRAREQAGQLEKTLLEYKSIQELVRGERHEVEDMIKNFNDPSIALSQIATSYNILKKEFELLKDSKRQLEIDKKEIRRKAEAASREAFEYKEQLKVVSNDLTHLSDTNKSLEKKIKKLEQAFASPSPRSSAIKRLIQESPAPLDLKRLRADVVLKEQEANGSLLLFDEHDTGNDSDGRDSGYSNEIVEEDTISVEEEESKELANEFGLNYVPTTSMTSNRRPLKDVNKNSILKLNMATKKPTSTSTTTGSTCLPHVRKGYNGMGGQSKVLILPKRNANFVKPLPAKKERKKIKIPRNNSTISKLFTTPRLPQSSP
ncbi:E3 ubiquitin-protein ligase TRAIP-like [Hydractinia symbiolongicarpus]|uniref:E3 ubiquitin-protein ligase TRAIP-like n=1 Tax=Hydractinia symbiolongicarpus TaxID=13093 RepID=UPI002550FB49|nr:E3 ubiquitin-protein ligase TRAIP-like [Hydractinia symbiolongicarpus]